MMNALLLCYICSGNVRASNDKHEEIVQPPAASPERDYERMRADLAQRIFVLEQQQSFVVPSREGFPILRYSCSESGILDSRVIAGSCTIVPITER